MAEAEIKQRHKQQAQKSREKLEVRTVHLLRYRAIRYRTIP
jgi:hypothetical protein